MKRPKRKHPPHLSSHEVLAIYYQERARHWYRIGSEHDREDPQHLIARRMAAGYYELARINLGLEKYQ